MERIITKERRDAVLEMSNQPTITALLSWVYELINAPENTPNRLTVQHLAVLAIVSSGHDDELAEDAIKIAIGLAKGLL